MIMPHEEKEELIVSPVSTTATGDFAACMAMASRFYADIDADFAARM
jgi:endoglucanase